MGVGKEQAALAILDHFRGQLTDSVIETLEEENNQSVWSLMVARISHNHLT